MGVFYREESASYPGKFLIRPKCEEFHLESTEGSFNIIAARVMGISYPQYLRMCRDCFGAEIIGKGSMYPVPYFSFTKESIELLNQLNARAKFILWEREHPDFEEHEVYVREKNPRFFEREEYNVHNL